MTLDLVIHYGGTAFLAAFAFFSSSLGQARIGKAALKASDRQPGDDRAIKKIFFTGIALSETVALIALGAAIYLFYSPITSPVQIYVRIAVYAAIIVPCVLISYLGSASIAESLQSAARQPFLVQQILNFMLVTQSLMQPPKANAAHISVIPFEMVVTSSCKSTIVVARPSKKGVSIIA